MHEKDNEFITLTETDVIEAIKSLDSTKQEIFKILATESINENIKNNLLEHLIKIDEGLIRKVGYRSSLEVKTHNKVVNLKTELRKISGAIKKLQKNE